MVARARVVGKNKKRVVVVVGCAHIIHDTRFNCWMLEQSLSTDVAVGLAFTRGSGGGAERGLGYN